jgi:hypothetical protein
MTTETRSVKSGGGFNRRLPSSSVGKALSNPNSPPNPQYMCMGYHDKYRYNNKKHPNPFLTL